mgnify:FL=1
MLRFILGGVALAVTGYGVKKYCEDESNCEEFENSVCGWIDKVEEKTDEFFDYASNAIDKLDEQKYQESKDLSENIEVDDSTQDKKITQIKSWNKISNCLN